MKASQIEPGMQVYYQQGRGKKLRAEVINQDRDNPARVKLQDLSQHGAKKRKPFWRLASKLTAACVAAIAVLLLPALAFAQAASTPPAPTGSLGAQLLALAVQYLVPALGLFLSAALTVVLTFGAGWLRQKASQEGANTNKAQAEQVGARAIDMMTQIVRNLWAVEREPLEAASATGHLSPEDKKRLADLAVTSFKASISDALKAQLQGVLGINDAGLAHFAAGLREIAVSNVKVQAQAEDTHLASLAHIEIQHGTSMDKLIDESDRPAPTPAPTSVPAPAAPAPASPASVTVNVAKVGALASSHDAQAARLPPAALGLLLCLGLIGLTGCAYLRPIPAAVDCVAKSAAPADIIKVIADLAGDNYVAAVVDGVAAGAAIYPCAVGLVEAELSAKASSSSAGSGGSPTVVEQALAAAGNADGHLVLMRIQALRAAGRLPACHYPAPVPNPAALPTPPAR